MVLLALSAGAPLAMVVLHVLIHRLARDRIAPGARLQLLARIELGVAFAWGVLAVLAFHRQPWPLLLLNTAYVVVVSLGFGYCYFIVFALSETALRIRLLLESYVAEGREGPAEGAGVAQEYNAEAMIGVRIDRLLAMGAAREEGGRLFGVRGLVYFFSACVHVLTSIWRAALFGRSPDGRSFEIWDDV